MAGDRGLCALPYAPNGSILAVEPALSGKCRLIRQRMALQPLPDNASTWLAILNNPWTISVAGGVVAGLLVLGIAALLKSAPRRSDLWPWLTKMINHPWTIAVGSGLVVGLILQSLHEPSPERETAKSLDNMIAQPAAPVATKSPIPPAPTPSAPPESAPAPSGVPATTPAPQPATQPPSEPVAHFKSCEDIDRSGKDVLSQSIFDLNKKIQDMRSTKHWTEFDMKEFQKSYLELKVRDCGYIYDIFPASAGKITIELIKAPDDTDSGLVPCSFDESWKTKLVTHDRTQIFAFEGIIDPGTPSDLFPGLKDCSIPSFE